MNFKHHGLAPTPEDAAEFDQSLGAFFAATSLSVFGVDFDDLSLISIIGHRRTENWLLQADAGLRDGKIVESLCCSAIAFHVFRTRFTSRDYKDRVRFDRWSNTDRSIEKLFNAVERMQRQLGVAADGISLVEYRRFD